jgi:MoaA/NifB/PqqE/SkfB family radical SAM enzyme/ubiquinone/menaquinone biosynthesis C-methylase UbiE
MNSIFPSLPDPWQRLDFEGSTIYVNPSRPDWLVPGPEARRLLEHQPGSPAEMLARAQLENQLAVDTQEPPYRGRSSYLQLTSLKECWFHLTSRCNLSCRHCLFDCSPAQSQSLAPDLLAQGLREARQLGSTLFYFTGGEPFLYPGFLAILKDLLSEADVHVVILTNGLLLEQHLAELTRLPKERLHLQISLDGLEPHHDQLRGPGTFRRVLDILATLHREGFRVTLSVAINLVNIDDLPAITALAADQGVTNLHFLWHLRRGKGGTELFVAPPRIFAQLRLAEAIAAARGVSIDNIETISSQVFSAPGTRFDLSNTGWESLTVGPDGNIYPSPALVGLAELNCGPLTAGLEQVWRHSPVLKKIRGASLIDTRENAERPLGFLTGGGDLDHSYLRSGEFVGHDPYLELYESLALWLISRRAGLYPVRNRAEIILRMGDVRHDCPDGGRSVSLTHCNCVISLPEGAGHQSVQEFYGQAARQTNNEIVNPFGPSGAGLTFIPLDSRKRSYGCGSPVQDAHPLPGEVLVDLGSGSGVECFLAAAQVGPTGRVFGIDMTREMLELARKSQADVVAELGFDNVEFRQGYLEDLPLPEATADVVISNCVINLSPDKRTTFHEIYRILKPGGRLVVSDIVTDTIIPVTIKNNLKFRGECLGGALQQEQLLAMLRAVGFAEAQLLKRFPYRQEGATRFFSLTFCCRKPATPDPEIEVVYRGPLAALAGDDGTLLFRGRPARISSRLAGQLGEALFQLDQQGGVLNQVANNGCDCRPSPEPRPASPCCPPGESDPEASLRRLPLNFSPEPNQTAPLPRQIRGCLVCGGEVRYLPRPEPATCHYCGTTGTTEVSCATHFVCDHCHLKDGLEVIKRVCTTSGEKDLYALLHLLRSHPTLAMHGPEHHAMIPGVILAAYRNNGGKLSADRITTGIDRGSRIPGGVCGFWGGCGAGLGVGIAFAVIMEATPLSPGARQQAQKITARVLARLAETKGARCCRREALGALREATIIADEILGITLPIKDERPCDQSDLNQECIRKACGFWERMNDPAISPT